MYEEILHDKGEPFESGTCYTLKEKSYIIHTFPEVYQAKKATHHYGVIMVLMVKCFC
jgi:uncharacterized circularly permuted ATP-grasp superfamily protein